MKTRTNASGVNSTQRRLRQHLQAILGRRYSPCTSPESGREVVTLGPEPTLGNFLRYGGSLPPTRDTILRVCQGLVVIENPQEATKVRVYPLRKGRLGRSQVELLVREIEHPGTIIETWGATDRRKKAEVAEAKRQEKEARQRLIDAQAETARTLNRVIEEAGTAGLGVSAAPTTEGTASTVHLTGPWTPQQVKLLIEAAERIRKGGES